MDFDSGGRVVPLAPRRAMSLPALRAAVGVIRAAEPARVLVAGSVGTDAGSYAEAVTPLPAATPAPVVMVLAGHPGAGASTVALAVAQALAVSWSVQLLEYADPRRSGLGAASDAELGVDEQGWRRGRRGRVELSRHPQMRSPADALPPPRPITGHGRPDRRLMVFDLGSTALPLLGEAAWIAPILGAASLVMVTRLTVPAVRQTEHVLTSVGLPAQLAVVDGARSWPRLVAASAGPAVRTARSTAVRVPIDRGLEVGGLTHDPLPKSVLSAGCALAAVLALEQPVLPGVLARPREEF